MSGKAGLNPRFDGAFLIQSNSSKPMALNCLNPRFDGAFLIPNAAANVQKILVS